VEKGFSLGYFDRTYLARWPTAVIEREGTICAFANLWPGPDHVEVSVDLMRYRHDAPKDVMESLFMHLLQWGQQQGYQRFALGMAPMSGFERSQVAPMWNRIGRLVYERGGSFYNFQGLRAYKEKFDPVWEPRYLAYPGGLVLPRALADVSALVSGGYRRMFSLSDRRPASIGYPLVGCSIRRHAIVSGGARVRPCKRPEASPNAVVTQPARFLL
jgi:phosphatidylglycerol lysyltransferase